MMWRSLSIGLMGVLAGCTMDLPSKSAPPAACDASRAETFVGKTGVDVAEQARIAAGAKLVRVIGPDQIVTMEFRADRLNVEIDGAGTVLKVRCG